MMSFQERAKLGLEQLSKQLPVTLEKCAETGREIKDGKLLKKQEEKRLRDFIDEQRLWKGATPSFFPFC